VSERGRIIVNERVVLRPVEVSVFLERIDEHNQERRGCKKAEERHHAIDSEAFQPEL
jgi:hypothetical protein